MKATYSKTIIALLAGAALGFASPAAPARQELSDTEIEEDVNDAFLWDPVTESWELDCSVNSVYSPYIDDWVLNDYDWYVDTNRFTTKTDWEIKEDIDDELFWSPFVDSDDVSVSVDDGVAELTGTVDTWAERETATVNAIEGGAVTVDNDLSVRYGPEYYEP